MNGFLFTEDGKLVCELTKISFEPYKDKRIIKVRCTVCGRIKRIQKWKFDFVERKKRQAEAAERTRRKHIEQGLCGKCGKRPSWDGRQLCYECTLKQRRQNSKKKYDYKDPNGCFRCGKPCVKGKRLCPEHYKISCDSIKKARESTAFAEAQKKNKVKIDAMWSEMIWREQKNAS